MASYKDLYGGKIDRTQAKQAASSGAMTPKQVLDMGQGPIKTASTPGLGVSQAPADRAFSGMSDADLSAKAAANSQIWHTSDAATRKQLEDANVAIRAELDRRQGTVSTRDGNGVWTTTAAPGAASVGKGISPAGGSAQSGTPDRGFALSGAEPKQDQPTLNDPYATGQDDYGDVDYSVLVQNAMAAGAPASEIQRLLDLRVQKALSKGYSQYAYDDVYRSGQAYIKNLTQPEEKKTEDYDLSEYLRKQAAARTQEALAGLKSAYDKSSAGYDDAMAQLPQKYQSARNEAAAQSALAQMAFDQRAAASGLSSGAAAQAGLDRAAAYQGAIGRLDQSQAADAAQLDRDKASLTAQYQDAIAKARAEGEANLADALYQEAARLQALDREDRDKTYERYVEELSRKEDNQRYADSLAADALDREYRDKVYGDSRADAALEREETARKEAQAKELDSATVLAQQGRFDALGAYYGWDSGTVAYMEGQYQAAKYQAAMSEVSKQAQTQADNLIKMGILPDGQTLELAGYSTSYAQTLAGAYAAKLAGTKKGSGGGGGGSGFPSSSGLTETGEPWSGLGQQVVGSLVGKLGGQLKGETEQGSAGSSYADLSRAVKNYIDNGLSREDAAYMLKRIDQALSAGTITRAQYNELGRRLGYE